MGNRELVLNTNKKVAYISFVLVGMSILGYIVEYLKGSRGIMYVLGMGAAVLLPVTISFVIYKMDLFVEQFRYIALFGFLLSWMIMLTFSTKIIQYVIVFPALMIYSTYFDYKLIRNASIIMAIFTVFKIILNIAVYKMTDDFITTEYSVMFLSIILFSYTAGSTTKFVSNNRKMQMENILAEEEKNKQLIEEMIGVLNIMSDTANHVTDLYEDLIDSSDSAADNISQLSIGMKEIADNLTEQSSDSEGMHENLLASTEMSNDALTQANVSFEAVESGEDAMQQLGESAVSVSRNNENVYVKMVELTEQATEMKNITDIIQSIANQTNLLALNAAIESARAGEAGKSFGVVAESIRELSTETSNALNSINELIDSLAMSANESLEASTESKVLGETQQALILQSKEVFRTMSESIGQVNESIKKSTEMNAETVDKNQKVVHSISNIASVVQQVAASTDETSDMVNKNKEITGQVKGYIDDLHDAVKSVEKYTVL